MKNRSSLNTRMRELVPLVTSKTAVPEIASETRRGGGKLSKSDGI
jgi:hypothetical protein